jgi:hypothetical protein
MDSAVPSRNPVGFSEVQQDHVGGQAGRLGEITSSSIADTLVANHNVLGSLNPTI